MLTLDSGFQEALQRWLFSYFPDPPTPSPASLSWPSCSEAISAGAAVLKTNQQLMMQLLSAQLYLVTWDSQPVPGAPSLVPYIWLNK